MLESGLRTGLRSASQLRDDVSAKRLEEAEKFSSVDPSILGKDSATVYRDKKSGKRMTAEEVEQKRAAQAKPKDPNEGKPEWGGGLVQKDERTRMKERLELEKNSKFARYEDDEELNDRQRGAVRWGDPMAGLVAGKSQGTTAAATTTKLPPSKRRCPHAPVPNRFGILPGFHWDGVDRSNGFEARVVQSRYDKRQNELLAYRVGCDDM